MASPSSPFLAIAQELRDLIYEYTLNCELPYDATSVRDHVDYRHKRLPIGTSDRWQWEAQHLSQPPTSTAAHLNLTLVNHQLRREIRRFLSRPGRSPQPLHLSLLLEYPKLYSTFTLIPQSPRHSTTLNLHVRVDHIFHPAYISRGSQNAILSAVSDTTKRYVQRGPHLARPSALRERLHLETVRITISAARGSVPDMRDEYGFVEQQVETLYVAFVVLLRRFARSGLPWGAVDAFEVRLEGATVENGAVGAGWERIPVTSNLWDEDDFVFFQYGGFNWDASDTSVVQPDLIAW